eukprot:1002109-Prorocentrum_minimum.AAC.2
MVYRIYEKQYCARKLYTYTYIIRGEIFSLLATLTAGAGAGAGGATFMQCCKRTNECTPR